MSSKLQSYGLPAALAVIAMLASGCEKSEAARASLPLNPPVSAGAADKADAPPVAESPKVAPSATAAPAAESTTMLTGTTEPHRRSVVATKVSGIISQVYVVEGQEVLEGDKIAALDTADFRLRLRQAEAGLNLARVQTRGVQREWERTQKLVAEKAAPSIQFDTLDSQLEAAKGGVAATEIGVAMARKALADTVIVAPFSGVVTQKMVAEGQWAGAMPPTPIAMIEEISTIDLRVDVPELWMMRVNSGTDVVVTFAATSDTRETKIARVIPSINPRSRSFSAIIELDNADKRLRPGMFAEIVIPAAAGE
jgi:RND family efflux transporter MFP subunit